MFQIGPIANTYVTAPEAVVVRRQKLQPAQPVGDSVVATEEPTAGCAVATTSNAATTESSVVPTALVDESGEFCSFFPH